MVLAAFRTMRWRPSRFETRLGIATTLLVAAICLGLSWQVARAALANLRAELEQRGRAVLVVLARDASPALQRSDVQALADLAERARVGSDVLAVRVFDPQGLLLFSTGTVGAGDEGPGVPDAGEIPTAPVDVGDDALEIWAAVPGASEAARPLGVVGVRVSLAPLRDLRHRIVLTVSALTVFFMLVGALGALALARALTRPVVDLAHAADAIARGDFGVRVDAAHDDEIGTLARAFNVMVASLAASRTALEQKIRELEQANHLKSEFLTTVSHELRTPLNVIIGNLEMMEEAGGQHAAVVETIRRYAKLQLDLVTSVLDFERLASGEVSLRVERFRIDTLVDDVLMLQRGRVRPGVQLHATVGLGDAELETDRVKLHQVVRNLVDNAVKFTESGRVTVEVEAVEPDRVAITVTDTGSGIPADALSHIFEPFHQLGAASTRPTNGVGLGLSIVDRLVTTLGGTVTVSSEEGWGSTFRVEVPRVLRVPAGTTTLAPAPPSGRRAA